MGDFYTAHPLELHGQPKRTIAAYVEQAGFPYIPRRFDSFGDALTSGVPFLARSEHPWEYDGPSGLRASLSSEKLARLGVETEAALLAYDRRSNEEDVAQFCHYSDVSVDEFFSAASFSYWELLSGLNRSVVPDSAIPKRYHVTTRERGGIAGYTVVESGKILAHCGDPLPREIKNGLRQLITDFEAIQNLPHFDSSHCGVVEFQTVGKDNHFLQYHRTRDSAPAMFMLEVPPREGYVKAMHVRGATASRDGEMVRATVVYAGLHRGTPIIPLHEEASFGFYMRPLLHEVRSRDRRVLVIEPPGRIPLLELLATGHVSRSMLFKPGISLVVPKHTVVPLERVAELREQALETGENQSVMLHVVSDGREAYVKMVG